MVSLCFVYIICVMILTLRSKVPVRICTRTCAELRLQLFVRGFFSSLMWRAAFSHEVLLDCTVNTLHVNGGNTMYQNCLIVRYSTYRNLLSCSERGLRRASTFSYQQIRVDSCVKIAHASKCDLRNFFLTPSRSSLIPGTDL